jgi:nitrate reductase delta subunit
MTPETVTLGHLAGLLDYPGPDLAARAESCLAALAGEHRTCADRLRRFAAAATRAPAGLEEAYTAAFDLAPVASPYVGDQLFGAGPQRSYLLSGLRELQRAAGVGPRAELPDHVAELLRLVVAPIPADVRDDLLRDGLAPALAKMLAALEAAGNPWADVVAAAGAVVAAAAGGETLAPRAEARPPPAQEVSP